MENLKSKIKSVKEVIYPFLNKPVKVYELVNNHKIVLGHKEGGLVNVSTWVKTGSINENDQNNGISHFLEHLMFKGTPSHPAGEFDRILEAKGAIVNAATWKDYTFYYVTLPKGENGRDFIEALELHADMMLNPTLPENEIGPVFDVNDLNVTEKRERYVVIEEIRMRDDQPWTKTYNELNHNMYNVHPYKRDVIGSAEIISTIPRDVIMEYYKNWYTPENMTTIIVGDIDFDKTLELVIKHFDFKEERSCKKEALPEVKGLKESVYLENKSNINTGFMLFGFHGSKACNLKDAILLDILGIVLGEGNSSRLYQNLIEKPETPVFNVINADQYQFRAGNVFFIQGNFVPEHKEQALEQIKEQVQAIIDEPISQEELNKSKKKLKVKFADSAETVSEIGETIGYYMTVCDELDMCGHYLKILDDITAEDVQKVAKEYLNLNKSAISVLIPE
ncbi:MAG: pitrilysin family protein [Candidatus Gastranaerophilaceae bacterium]|jgi:zinc protease